MIQELKNITQQNPKVSLFLISNNSINISTLYIEFIGFFPLARESATEHIENEGNTAKTHLFG